MVSELLLDYFRGREGVFAVANAQGFQPVRGASISADALETEHLAGHTCYGFYLMQSDNTIWCSAVDHDNKSHAPDPMWQSKTEAVYRYLTERHIPSLIEVSQSGEAAHNWVFFTQPIAARDVRAFWRKVSDDLGIKFKEIYPRQDQLKEDGLGNLIRYPLWNKSRFVDVNWQTVEPHEALTIGKVTPSRLLEFLPQRVEAKAEGISQRVEKIISQPGSLASRWQGSMEGLADQSRSAVCLSIAIGLVRRFVPTNEIAQALRAWCRQHDYDKGERDNWIDLTIQKAYEFVATNCDGQAEQGPIVYPSLTCKELCLGDFSVRYLIKDTLVAGQPGILGAPKKALKTSVSIDMGISLATGSPFLGRLSVLKPCRVAIMSGESGLGALQDTALRVCASKGHKLQDIDNLIWSTSLPRFGEPAHEEALRQFISTNRIEVLILDPTYLMMPGADAGNLFVQGELLLSVSEVCQERGVTLLLVHHLKKGTGASKEPPELDDLSWAGFSEFARQWLLIGRRTKYEPGSGKHELWLSVGGSAGHSNLWSLDVDEGASGLPRCWHVELSSPSEARTAAKEAELDDAKVRVIGVLRKWPDGETRRAIRDEARISDALAKKALNALEDEGSIETCKVKKSGRPFDAFRLLDLATAA